MNREEIDYWLKSFSNNNQSFMSKDGKIITLFKVFQELKELQYLLKIKNDYINELEAYKYNMDRDYLKLEKENKILRENAEHNDKVVDKVNWENLKLKKELEEIKLTNKVLSEELTKDKILKQDCLTTIYDIPIGDIPKLINQQKEFIEWLTNEANINPYDISDYVYENIINAILSKYKEIIG